MADIGHWSATDVSSILVPANQYRAKLVLQMRAGDPGALAFGKPAVFADGVQMRSMGSCMLVEGPLSREAVYGVCNTGTTATGGYQENLGVTL